MKFWLAIIVTLMLCGSLHAQAGPQSVYDVRKFGATPDDATDDTAAIQAAIDAAEADNPATVTFPRGQYRSTNLTLTEDGVTLTGYGASILQHATLGTGDGACILKINGNRCIIEGLEFDGNVAAAIGSSKNRCVQIQDGSVDDSEGNYNVLRDLYCHDTYNDPANAQAADTIQIVNGDNNLVDNCTSVNAGWNGIRVAGNGNHVKDCRVIDYLGRGIRFNSGESGYVTGCFVSVQDKAAGACILVDPEDGELYGTFFVRDCTVFNDSTRSPGTNSVKIARVKYAVVDGGDYEIGPTQPSENQGIRLEDTVEHCVIQNLRTDAIMMTNGLFQAVLTSHATADSGNRTTFTIDATSLSSDTDMDEVDELLSNGKEVFIYGSGIPAYNTRHTVISDGTTPLTNTTFTVTTDFIAGTLGTCAAHDATDRLEVRNVHFGHGIHNVVTPLENIKGRYIDIENCYFDLRDSDGNAATGATSAIEWACPDDRAFDRFRAVNCEAIFAKSSAQGKLIQPEETSATLLTSGKIVSHGHIVRNISASGTAVVVNETGATDRDILFNTDGESSRTFLSSAVPVSGGGITWSDGDRVINSSPNNSAKHYGWTYRGAWQAFGDKPWFSSLADSTSFTAVNHGEVYRVTAANLDMTLPDLDATNQGTRITFILASAGLAASDGATTTGEALEIFPHSSDTIVLAGETNTAAKALRLDGNGDREGDMVTLVCGASGVWYVTEIVGTWNKSP